MALHTSGPIHLWPYIITLLYIYGPNSYGRLCSRRLKTLKPKARRSQHISYGNILVMAPNSYGSTTLFQVAEDTEAEGASVASKRKPRSVESRAAGGTYIVMALYSYGTT